MQSLFPQTVSSGAGQSAGGNGTTIISFKAGKIDLDGPKANGSYKATADRRRGTVSLVRTNDQLVHFRWTDRVSGAIEDDRILFPDEISFQKVKTGRDGDRVYMIKYSSGAEPMMFWMQDKSAEKDEEQCAKINEYANNPAAAAEAASSTSAPTPASGAQANSAIPGANDDTASVASNGESDALSALLASLSATSNTSPGGPRNPLSADAFREIMSQSAATPTPPATTRAATNEAAEQQANAPQPLELQEVLTADSVLASGILDDTAVCEQLIAQLPEGQRTHADLEAALRSPQLADSMRALSSALQSENYNAVMANFGLDPSTGMSQLMQGNAVEAFISAVQSLADQSAGADANAGAGDDAQNAGGSAE